MVRLVKWPPHVLVTGLICRTVVLASDMRRSSYELFFASRLEASDFAWAKWLGETSVVLFAPNQDRGPEAAQQVIQRCM